MTNIINISEGTSIAIHSMVLIAQNPNGLNATEIAEKMNFSRNHLAKVLLTLTKNDLLDSTRGPKGGFILKKKASTISLLNVYELMEGKIKPVSCIANCKECLFKRCIFSNVLEKATFEFREYLKSTKISDLI